MSELLHYENSGADVKFERKLFSEHFSLITGGLSLTFYLERS